jgi:hypothetical protein
MTYSITKYTFNKAKQLGVIVKPSTNKMKKIDVYKTNKKQNKKQKTKQTKTRNTLVKVASIGAAGMNDYPTYTKKKGILYAKTRRRLYKIRHQKDRTRTGSPGWYADKLLW